jgi:hypothetical protein
MIKQQNKEHLSQFESNIIFKKDIIHKIEKLKEINEAVDKRCCICLEEMRARTKPEECNHTYCRQCISAWTSHSNVCPLCKIEIKYLLIYRERPEPEEEQNLIYAGDFDH